jgi:NAD(P) transhydrogenase subunit alpha
MIIYIPREPDPAETRIPLVPSVAKKLVSLGAELQIEAGLGKPLAIPDSDYSAVGAKVSSDRGTALGAADLVLRLNKPGPQEISSLKKGSIHISLLDPFNSREILQALAKADVSAIAMDMIPRTTLAQKMDVLSSQANLAGYIAVILSATHLNRILPMMMTPAGTISPSRVFIIGAGVAGLQAIATAKRLGARVEAFDTRPVVEEQVKSLGAKFVKIDLGETGQTKDGYARALTEEQLQKQREGMAKVCAESDIVITTAQVFGRKAPRILTTDMVKGMKPGSVVLDMAVETGGNVECSKLGEIVEVNGVKVVGYGNLPGRAPVHASQMYASNIGSMLEHYWDKEKKAFVLNRDDEIIKGCLVTHGGEICHPALKG